MILRDSHPLARTDPPKRRDDHQRHIPNSKPRTAPATSSLTRSWHRPIHGTERSSDHAPARCTARHHRPQGNAPALGRDPDGRRAWPTSSPLDPHVGAHPLRATPRCPRFATGTLPCPSRLARRGLRTPAPSSDTRSRAASTASSDRRSTPAPCIPSGCFPAVRPCRDTCAPIAGDTTRAGQAGRSPQSTEDPPTKSSQSRPARRSRSRGRSPRERRASAGKFTALGHFPGGMVQP